MGQSRGRKRSRADFEQDLGENSNQFGIGDTVSLLKGDANTSEQNLRQPTSPSHDTAVRDQQSTEGQGWQVVQNRNRHGKSKGKNKSKAKQLSDDRNVYPELTHSPNARLQTEVRISDLQALVLYLLADGPSPQWIAIRHHLAIRKVVVVMVPGLERDLFFGDLLAETTFSAADASVEMPASVVQQNRDTEAKVISPDDYYPVRLEAESLPAPLRPMARIFPHLWPVKTPGDTKINRMHSPLQAMLSAPIVKPNEGKEQKGPRPPREGKTWEDQPSPISTFMATADDLRDNEYVMHPALLQSDLEQEVEQARRNNAGQTTREGWTDSKSMVIENTSPNQKLPLVNDATAGRQVFAIDCEMCMVENSALALTRISVVDWNGVVVMDELVKPDQPITDYLTAFSGITAEKLANVNTTLKDIQARLLDLLSSRTILIGHSLNSDLIALKLTHPYIVDTAIIYPHPRGPPLKSSLKWLAQKYLSRDIQAGRTGQGHDSIEDARAALDLVKLKCRRGPRWGTPEATLESIFKRVARAPKPRAARQSGSPSFPPLPATSALALTDRCTTALVDWGFPKRGYGAAADFCIGCNNDTDVAAGVVHSVQGDPDGAEIPGSGVEFVWARMRELEAVRGWWSASKTADNDALRDKVAKLTTSNPGPSDPSNTTPAEQWHDSEALSSSSSVTLADAASRTVTHIQTIYDSLPPCTAFIVYSGSGDPRAYQTLLAQQAQYKREYATKKWDEISVKWGDREERDLVAACRRARQGVGFVCVK